MTDPWPAPQRGAAFGLVLLLTVLLAVWGSFLVPFRVADVLVPVSWVLAVGGNVVLGRAADRLVGPPGAVASGLLWVVLVLVLSGRRAEGDVVIAGTWVGTGFLLVGAGASAVAYGLAQRSEQPRDRRDERTRR